MSLGALRLPVLPECGVGMVRFPRQSRVSTQEGEHDYVEQAEVRRDYPESLKRAPTVPQRFWPVVLC